MLVFWEGPNTFREFTFSKGIALSVTRFDMSIIWHKILALFTYKSHFFWFCLVKKVMIPSYSLMSATKIKTAHKSALFKIIRELFNDNELHPPR